MSDKAGKHQCRSKAELLGELSSMFSVQCEAPSKAELAAVSRGSIVAVVDPERDLCYWAVIERHYGDECLVATINANCHLAGPSLRHGGTIAFHVDNILYVWPRKADPFFDSLWFRFLRHVMSFSSGMKALERPTES